jgi:hypothetical protein
MSAVIKGEFGKRLSTRRNVGFAILVVLVVATAGLLLARSGASGFFASAKVASGTLTGNAQVISDASAYGGQAVVFNSSVTPDPDPSPGNGTATCPAFPAFPDENCTGWRHTGRQSLQNCDNRTDNGYIWDDNPDKTFIGCYFSQRLVIQASNVVITESQIHGVIVAHGSNGYSLMGAKFTDVEIENCYSTTDCTTVNPNMNYDNDTAAITGHDFTCTRCHVHNTVTGMHPGDRVEITDSYMHDFQIEPDTNDQNAPDRNHGAGIGIGQNSGNHTRIIHNNIQCNRLQGQYQQCSSALSLYDEPRLDDVFVKNNLFNARNGWCVIGGGSNGTNIKFIDNYFGKKFNPYCGGQSLQVPVAFFYPPNDNVSTNGGDDGGCTFPQATSPKCNWGNEWSGNVWADGSGTVPYKD